MIENAACPKPRMASPCRRWVGVILAVWSCFLFFVMGAIGLNWPTIRLLDVLLSDRILDLFSLVAWLFCALSTAALGLRFMIGKQTPKWIGAIFVSSSIFLAVLDLLNTGLAPLQLYLVAPVVAVIFLEARAIK